ncbi:MAG: hypothetical protein GC165_06135 [Armatimonadetes bacterium]|nr:hypothetical protein [Armatimonadota bacterium]
MTRAKRGLTLVEICMVSFILAFLAAMTFPIIASAKMSAKEAAATSNLRQLGLAIELYRQDNDALPKPGLPDYTIVDYFSAPQVFGSQTAPLWMSPCGTHPDTAFLVAKAKTNLMYLASTQEDELFVRAYQEKGDSTAFLFDLNCNPADTSVVEGIYIKKKAIALRLDGSVEKKYKYGSPYDPLDW